MKRLNFWKYEQILTNRQAWRAQASNSGFDPSIEELIENEFIIESADIKIRSMMIWLRFCLSVS